MIDTHCHLDLYRDPYSVAKAIEREKIITIAVTNLPSHFDLTQNHVAKYKRIRPAIGLHPLLAKQHESELFLFRQLIDRTSYIGEVGLDFSKYGIYTKEIQLMSFQRVLDYAKDRPRVISLHTRGAEEIVLEMIDRYDSYRGVFHWYGGSLKTWSKLLLRDIISL